MAIFLTICAFAAIVLIGYCFGWMANEVLEEEVYHYNSNNPIGGSIL